MRTKFVLMGGERDRGGFGGGGNYPPGNAFTKLGGIASTPTKGGGNGGEGNKLPKPATQPAKPAAAPTPAPQPTPAAPTPASPTPSEAPVVTAILGTLGLNNPAAAAASAGTRGTTRRRGRIDTLLSDIGGGVEPLGG